MGKHGISEIKTDEMDSDLSRFFFAPQAHFDLAEFASKLLINMASPAGFEPALTP
jgi:hypothetical protein